MSIPTAQRSSFRPAPAVLVGGAFVLTTISYLLIWVAVILLTDTDPYKPEGAVDSIVSQSIVGTVGLAIALAIGFGLRSRPDLAAIVLGALAIITLPVFWSGTPAVLGAAAAWRAGLAKDTPPQTGVARGFGIAGIVIAVLVILGNWAGFAAGIASGSY